MGDIVFKIEIGGFFADRHTLTIRETGTGFVGTYESMFGLEDKRTFPVSKEQVAKLDAFIEEHGISNWYSDYFNPCVLDGVQWSVDDGYSEHTGSNFFPAGFKALTQFVAEEFDLVGFMPEEEFIEDDLNEETELAILASDLRSEDDGSNLLHDLYAFVERHPEYKHYQEVLEEYGIELDPEEIKRQDMKDADRKLIVASMIALSRADYFDGYSEHFKTAAQDGTFEAWLKRLDELVLPSAWIN